MVAEGLLRSDAWTRFEVVYQNLTVQSTYQVTLPRIARRSCNAKSSPKPCRPVFGPGANSRYCPL